MKISVLTVCFNSAQTIDYTLSSFVEQDYPDKELVIIDGNSQDETLAIARRYESENVRIVSEPDEGMYDALNKGLKLFTGDAVGILNSDDRYSDDRVLSRIAEGLSEKDMVSGNLIFVNNHWENTVMRRWNGAPYKKGAIQMGWHPAHPTFYVRRKVAEAVGDFNLNYKTASDYDWMIRAHECFDFSSGFIDETLIHMMTGGRSTASIGAHIQHNWDSLKSRRQWMNAGVVDLALFVKPLRKIWQFRLH